MKIISGFTLIELMVVIAVLAIIATMATPSLARLLKSAALNSQSRELSMAIAETRSNAVFTSKPSTLHLGKQDPLLSDNSTAKVDFYWNTEKQVEYKSSITELTFLPSGVIKGASNEISLELCNDDLGSIINLSSQGSLRSMKNGACS